MRTILFRGKTLKDHGMLPAGSWITGGYYMDDCYGGCPQGRHYILTWNSGGPGGFMDRVEVERESVGQYTGLNDRNGKWIFEGDMLKYDGGLKPQFVKWSNWMAGFTTALSEHSGTTGLHGNCEIIGNRFEHPELLDKP